MHHTLILSEAEYNATTSFIITKSMDWYMVGDEITLTKEGSRDQRPCTITSIVTGDKIHKGWCVLGLEDSGGVAEQLAKIWKADPTTIDDSAEVADALSGEHGLKPPPPSY